jgi:hypothetical protein
MGFSIHSALDFRSLRSGGGSPLTVDHWSGSPPDGESLVTWRPRRGNPFHGRLLRRDGGYAFWASDAGWYVVDPAVPSIAVDGSGPSLLAELRLFGVPISLCATAAGDIALHASGVAIDGRGVLFAAPSMFGKTTTAAAFAAHGHRLLAEDTVRCGTSPPVVYPGPAVVRLREDVASQMSLAHSVREPMPNGRVCIVLDQEHRGDGAPVPLRAIILLRSGEEISLQAVRKQEATRDLFALSFVLPIREQRSAVFSRIVDLVNEVEVLNLYRPLRLAAMRDVVETVEAYVTD